MTTDAPPQPKEFNLSENDEPSLSLNLLELVPPSPATTSGEPAIKDSGAGAVPGTSGSSEKLPPLPQLDITSNPRSTTDSATPKESNARASAETPPKSLEKLAEGLDAAFKAGGKIPDQLKQDVDKTFKEHLKNGGTVTEFNNKVNDLIKTPNQGIWATQKQDGNYGLEYLKQIPGKPNDQKDKYPFSNTRVEKLDEQVVKVPQETAAEAQSRKTEARQKVEKMTPEECKKALDKHAENVQDMLKKNQAEPGVAAEKFKDYIEKHRFELNELATKADGKQNPLTMMSDQMNKGLKDSKFRVDAEVFRGPGGGFLSLADRKSGNTLSSAYAGTFLSKSDLSR